MQLRLDVNDQTMQEDSTANMIWNIREQIAYLSTIVNRIAAQGAGMLRLFDAQSVQVH